MKIKIAFYKGGREWQHKIIRWWTKSIYSHVELIMPDNYTWISISPFLESKVAKRIKTDFDLENWDFVSIDITEKQHNSLISFYNQTEGSNYDWIGMLLSQLTPFKIKSKHKWYCSEWITHALVLCGILSWQNVKIYDKINMRPSDLYQIVENYTSDDAESDDMI